MSGLTTPLDEAFRQLVESAIRFFSGTGGWNEFNNTDFEPSENQGSVLPPSDLGLDGAIPLDPEEPREEASEDQGLDWTTQNRRINDLLMGRADA